MKSSSSSRRSVLQGMGAAAFAATASGIVPRTARAAGEPPRRIAFFYTMHGSMPDLWAPGPAAGAAAPSERSWQLGQLHGALTDFKDDLVFIDGMDMKSESLDKSDADNSHSGGQTHSMTGTSRVGGNMAGGISIDQFIAKQINSPKAVTAVPSVEMLCSWFDFQLNRVPYAGSGSPVPMILDPKAVFDRLFKGFTPPAPGMAPKGPDPQDAVKQKIFDYLQGAYSGPDPKISKVDKMRFEAHAQALSDLRARLQVATPSVAAACSVPSTAPFGKVGQGSNEAQYETSIDVHMRNVQAAFACDRTRVATFVLNTMPDQYPGVYGGQRDLHELIHSVANRSNTDPAAYAVVKKYHQINAGYFAKFLKMLKSIPESDGQTLLDHTIVVWCGEVAEGWHGLKGLPWLIAGRGGGAVKTGRYLKVSPGTPHNNLFVSLANAMGIATQTFGNPAACTGPLAGLVST